MRKIYSAEGLDESTARLVVAQEQLHGRYVEAYERGGRWFVSVYLMTGWELLKGCPAWLRRVWEKEGDQP